jgi:hypothetical protein
MTASKMICLDCHSEDAPRPGGLLAALLLVGCTVGTVAAHVAESGLFGPLLLATLVHASVISALDPRRPSCRHCGSRSLAPRGTPRAAALRSAARGVTGDGAERG